MDPQMDFKQKNIPVVGKEWEKGMTSGLTTTVSSLLRKNVGGGKKRYVGMRGETQNVGFRGTSVSNYSHLPVSSTTSCGIFLYDEDREKFLVIQNRDSQAFLYFFMIRGIETWETDRLISLLDHCTHDEIQRLLFYPFDKLYMDLYLFHDPVRYHKQEKLAFTNYRYFHSRKDIQSVVMKLRGTPILWEFPKGKLEKGEKPFAGACREFREETGIDLNLEEDVMEHSRDVLKLEFMKPKPYLGHRVPVVLYGVSFKGGKSHPQEDSGLGIGAQNLLKYEFFNQGIRSYSLSNECLHGKWIGMGEADLFLPHYLSRVLHTWVMDHGGLEAMTQWFLKLDSIE
jgi:8-oxo-dGTP pyrophosphatase MutT (NUDIX family)